MQPREASAAASGEEESDSADEREAEAERLAAEDDEASAEEGAGDGDYVSREKGDADRLPKFKKDPTKKRAATDGEERPKWVIACDAMGVE